MSRVIQISDSKTSSLTSCDSGYHIHTDSSNLNNACDGDDTTYAQIRFVNGSNAETYIFYNFSTISIPQGATNISVACSVKGYLYNTGGTSTRQLQLYSGSTAMGTATSITTSGLIQTLSLTPGTWTAAELSSAKLRFYAKRNTSATTSNRYYRLYEAVMTVTYTYDQLQYEVTATSNSQSITVSSAQEFVNAGDDYDLDIYGDITNADVTDNNTDIKSSLVTIATDEYRYSLTNLQADHAIAISVVGDKIFINVNGTWQEAADIKVKVNGAWQSASKAFKKLNGAWVNQGDKSAIFDQDALFVYNDFRVDENASAHVNVTCFDGGNGSVTVVASGGAAPYQYSLDPTFATYNTDGVFSNLSLVAPVDEGTDEYGGILISHRRFYVRDANGQIVSCVVDLKSPVEFAFENVEDITLYVPAGATEIVAAPGVDFPIPNFSTSANGARLRFQYGSGYPNQYEDIGGVRYFHFPAGTTWNVKYEAANNCGEYISCIFTINVVQDS